MPNRIIRESICTSDSVDKLSWFEEVLFYRLIVNCDDFVSVPLRGGGCFPDHAGQADAGEGVSVPLRGVGCFNEKG